MELGHKSQPASSRRQNQDAEGHHVDAKSIHTAPENDVAVVGIQTMKGTPRNTQVEYSEPSQQANSTMVKEGGQYEGDEGPSPSSNGLLAMSL